METEKSPGIINLSYLKRISNGDQAFIDEMIAVYLQQTPEAILNLETYLAAEDWDRLTAVSHKLKPSCTFFGLTGLYELIGSIEDYTAKKIHLDRLPEMISRVKSTCENAMQELIQWQEQKPV